MVMLILAFALAFALALAGQVLSKKPGRDA